MIILRLTFRALGIVLGFFFCWLSVYATIYVFVRIYPGVRDVLSALVRIAVGLIGLVLCIGGWAVIVGFFNNLAERIEKRATDEKLALHWAKLAEEQHKSGQLALHRSILDHVSSSKALAEELPDLVHRAHQALIIAERELTVRGFDSFWRAMESATKCLESYANYVDTIIRHSRQYREEVPLYDGQPPVFLAGFDTLPDASHISTRIRSIFRLADKDYQFLEVYQRRQAIVGSCDLKLRLEDFGTRIEGNQNEVTAIIASRQLEPLADQLNSELRKVREMLDNIQHHQKPE